MPAQPRRPLRFDPSAAGELACPVCFGALQLEAARLVCAGCGRAYPVVDGIPVLIAERAEAAPGEDALP
jgi:hypothetical protein